MDMRMLSLFFCFLFLCVQSNFAVGRISTRPSAGKRSLRSSLPFPAKYAIIRTAFENEEVCSLPSMVEVREQMDELRSQLQDLQFQYDTCLQLH